MVKSEKFQLACRVSSETFNKVRALTDGENSPFKSVAEYLQSLIHADLARREMKQGIVPMRSFTDYYNDLEKRISILEKEKLEREKKE